MTDDQHDPVGDEAGAVEGTEPADDAGGSDRLHRATIEFGLNEEQADRFQHLVALVSPGGDPDDDDSGPSADELSRATDTLDDPIVAEAAWTRWADDDMLGGPVDTLVAAFGEPDADTPRGGVAWLCARHHAWHGRTDESIAALEGARATGHTLVLCELAAIEADRSRPGPARDLLREGGVNVQIDLDAEYDPLTADSGFGPELAEEIAPFAAIRPKPMAGRNDKCPCGSGKKYKQCHIGNELHALDDRAGWLYVKLMRFMQVNSSLFPAVIADDLIDGVVEQDLRSMVHESYLPVDLALFEGGVAQWFLDAKQSLLPNDEIEMLESWIGAQRSVYEVVRSRPGSMDVLDLATRERMTVQDTVPDEPLETGWRIIGRLVPVGDTFRAYGGFLPVNDDMVEPMLQGFATGSLETVVLTIGQVFETAATQDEIQELFADSLDTGELRELLDGFDSGSSDET